MAVIRFRLLEAFLTDDDSVMMMLIMMNLQSFPELLMFQTYTEESCMLCGKDLIIVNVFIICA